MSKPREARFRKLITALQAADAALESVILNEPISDNDSRTRLRRDITEYWTYLENATWWRHGKPQ